MHNYPLIPISKRRPPSPYTLLGYVKKHNIIPNCNLDAIMQIMRAMEMEGLVEKIKPITGVQAVQGMSDSEGDDEAGPSKRRKKSKGSDSETDSDDAEMRKAREKAKMKKKKEKEKERAKEKEREKKKREKEKAKEKKRKERRERKEKERKKRKREVCPVSSSVVSNAYGWSWGAPRVDCMCGSKVGKRRPRAKPADECVVVLSSTINGNGERNHVLSAGRYPVDDMACPTRHCPASDRRAALALMPAVLGVLAELLYFARTSS